ncbi:GGDEF domain-containing protein, partial [Leptospira sp. SA-E8]|uniref:GGDEF domain-containing protein n=1 Tax=Leptospira sp. SA-E8 TaxID=3422259 RepID=UPI003EBC7F7B
RLAHALARGIYQAEDFNRDDLQLRYDIFVSRIGQLKIGVYAELLRDDPGYRQILTSLHGFVAEADRYLGAGLARVELDRTALRRLQARFAELRDPLNDQLLLANQRNGAMLDLQRAQVREQVIFNMVLTAVQSLLALVLALAVLRETRRRAQSHAALLAAQATTVENLRRHESELEQRIAERTVELEQANQQLAALSMTDGLTGLANRRRFDAALTAEWRRAERARQPLALALLDVDWFKNYNDHYGH